MSEYKLQHEFISVIEKNTLTYGGAQQMSDIKSIQKCGCGIVAAADFFIYTHRNRPGCYAAMLDSTDHPEAIPVEKYNEILKALNRKYFPLMVPFGLNGLALVCGMNMFFHANACPLRAQWGVKYNTLWQSIESMLKDDLPVIISVGKSFPFVWENNKLSLYTRFPNGNYNRVNSVRAHYMTVTAIDEEWLTVSSWGRKYYIRRSEYDAYTRDHSTGVLCNIAYVVKS